MDGFAPRAETEFNMSVMTLGRINYSLLVCSEHRRAKDLSDWFFELQNLYIEASSEMRGDMQPIIDKYTKEIPAKFNTATDEDGNDFEEVERLIDMIEPLISKYKDNPSITRKLFKMLMALEMIIRKTLKSSGLLMKMKDDLFQPTQKWE